MRYMKRYKKIAGLLVVAVVAATIIAVLPETMVMAANPFSKVTNGLETLKNTAIEIAQVLGGLLAVIGAIIAVKGYGNHQNGQEMSMGAKLVLCGIGLAGIPSLVAWFM